MDVRSRAIVEKWALKKLSMIGLLLVAMGT
eukprot:IDg7325t1